VKGVGELVVVKADDSINVFEAMCERAVNGEAVMFTMPQNNRQFFVLSNDEFNEMEKARRNIEYLNKLEHSVKRIEEGDCITFNDEETEKLFGMENPDEIKKFGEQQRQKQRGSKNGNTL
jgi:hypothetical protein